MQPADYLQLDEIGEKSLSLKEHIHSVVVWCQDHIEKREIIIGIWVSGLAVFSFIHKADFFAAWNACTIFFASLGLFAVVPVALMCMIATIVGFPVDFILVWSGAFFQSTHGQLLGTALGISSCCVGVYVGCILAFLLGRTVLKPRVEKYIAKFQLLQVMNSIIETDGWKFALIMRLSPLMPNEPLNYACALTSMSLKHMAIATLGSLPKAAYEVWLSAQAAASFSSHSRGSSLSSPFILALNGVLLAIMVALCFVGRQRYESYIENSKAIPALERSVMRRRSSLKGFDAEYIRTRSIQNNQAEPFIVHDSAVFAPQLSGGSDCLPEKRLSRLMPWNM